MALKRTWLAMATLVVLINADQGEPGSNAGHAPIDISDRFIITLKPEVDVFKHMNFVQDIHAESLGDENENGRYRGVSDQYNISSFQAYSGHFHKDVAARLASHEDVESVEPDQIWTTSGILEQKHALPGLSMISSRNPRQPTLGLYRYDQTAGFGTYAYVVDSGINKEHQDFEGRASAGWNVITKNSRDWNDQFGHGTNVAGIIGGATYGVAKKTNLVAVKVCNDNNAMLSNVIAGFQWAVQDISSKGRKEMSVVNIPVYGRSVTAWAKAIDAASEKGITTILCAGNDDMDMNSGVSHHPKSAIIVSATDGKAERAPFANWGSSVDIFAPGVRILSASAGGRSKTAFGTGTSQASAYVAGLAVYFKRSEGGLRNGLLTKRLILRKAHEHIVRCPSGGTLPFAYNGLGNPRNDPKPKAPVGPSEPPSRRPGQEPPRRPAPDGPRRPGQDPPRRPAPDVPRRPGQDPTRRPAPDVPRRPGQNPPRRPAPDVPKRPAPDVPRRPGQGRPRKPEPEEPSKPPGRPRGPIDRLPRNRKPKDGPPIIVKGPGDRDKPAAPRRPTHPIWHPGLPKDGQIPGGDLAPDLDNPRPIRKPGDRGPSGRPERGRQEPGRRTPIMVKGPGDRAPAKGAPPRKRPYHPILGEPHNGLGQRTPGTTDPNRSKPVVIIRGPEGRDRAHPWPGSSGSDEDRYRRPRRKPGYGHNGDGDPHEGESGEDGHDHNGDRDSRERESGEDGYGHDGDGDPHGRESGEGRYGHGGNDQPDEPRGGSGDDEGSHDTRPGHGHKEGDGYSHDSKGTDSTPLGDSKDGGGRNGDSGDDVLEQGGDEIPHHTYREASGCPNPGPDRPVVGMPPVVVTTQALTARCRPTIEASGI